MQRHPFTPDELTFRVLGQLVLAGAVALLILFFANLRSRFYYGAQDLSSLGYLAIYGIVVGYGLTQNKKWAAVLLAAPLSLFGVFIVIKAVVKQPMWWVVFVALFWAVVLSIPGALTVRRWRTLR